jgi:hypothetical protein
MGENWRHGIRDAVQQELRSDNPQRAQPNRRVDLRVSARLAYLQQNRNGDRNICTNSLRADSALR